MPVGRPSRDVASTATRTATSDSRLAGPSRLSRAVGAGGSGATGPGSIGGRRRLQQAQDRLVEQVPGGAAEGGQRDEAPPLELGLEPWPLTAQPQQAEH